MALITTVNVELALLSMTLDNNIRLEWEVTDSDLLITIQL
jgi:hypothetical protein